MQIVASTEVTISCNLRCAPTCSWVGVISPRVHTQEHITIESGYTGEKSFCLPAGTTQFSVECGGGLWGGEVSWEVQNKDGDVVFSGGGSAGTTPEFATTCESLTCAADEDLYTVHGTQHVPVHSSATTDTVDAHPTPAAPRPQHQAPLLMALLCAAILLLCCQVS